MGNPLRGPEELMGNPLRGITGCEFILKQETGSPHPATRTSLFAQCSVALYSCSTPLLFFPFNPSFCCAILRAAGLSASIPSFFFYPHRRNYIMAIDPVCGMTVDEAKGISAEKDGTTYYFCCEQCRKRFLGETPVPRPPDQKGSRYYCPMCPGVESDTPGACPKCGMALESAADAIEKRTVYTCPMHPEVIRDHPGACPK